MREPLNLAKTWWLLALCGVFDAVHAAVNLVMLNPERSFELRRFASHSAGWDMGALALAAGVCAILAGLWSVGRNNSWLISLHGLALAFFGLIAVSPLVRRPLGFRLVALLFIVMSVSIAAFAFVNRGSLGKWMLSVSAVVASAFALSFIAVAFGRIRLGPPAFFWIWMSAFFAFCAIFMLWLGLRLRGGSSLEQRSFAVAAR